MKSATSAGGRGHRFPAGLFAVGGELAPAIAVGAAGVGGERYPECVPDGELLVHGRPVSCVHLYLPPWRGSGQAVPPCRGSQSVVADLPPPKLVADRATATRSGRAFDALHETANNLNGGVIPRFASGAAAAGNRGRPSWMDRPIRPARADRTLDAPAPTPAPSVPCAECGRAGRQPGRRHPLRLGLSSIHAAKALCSASSTLLNMSIETAAMKTSPSTSSFVNRS